MSTLALGGSEATAPQRPGIALRYGDLILLAAALPLFAFVDLPLLGYAAAAAAWVAQHALYAFAQRNAAAALRRGDRRRALAAIGVTTLARVWLVTLAILLVGLLGEREDGLAAAVLSFALVTAHLGSMALTRLLYPEEQAR